MPIGFHYRKGRLHCDGVPLDRIAEREGTPAYVYSRAVIEHNFLRFDRAFGRYPHMICYAVKACGNLSILRLLAKLGAGFDIVSGGELFRVLKAGGDPRKIVFSGVGKTEEEIDAALRAGIFKFNVESESELELLHFRAAKRRQRARIALRVNPDVDAQTHPYISTGLREHKFGVDMETAERLYRKAAAMPSLEVTGVSCHIGSQILDPTPLLDALDRLLNLAKGLQSDGLPIRYLDIGGGLGVPYKPGDPKPDPQNYVKQILSRVKGSGLTVLLEPGRSIVGQAGALLTKIINCKSNGNKTFVIVDAAMNDLIRPALYQAHHEILPVLAPSKDAESKVVDVVGPVCETGDFLARNRAVSTTKPGALLVFATAGAYGSVLGSNYNARLRPPELLVAGSRYIVARKRERLTDLVTNES